MAPAVEANLTKAGSDYIEAQVPGDCPVDPAPLSRQQPVVGLLNCADQAAQSARQR
ncbi:hypothetical protein [Streptomyces sp. NBC_01716]|uniref:hypothetical protein n=1 Tax=Streptomyces sp. NBC_01716 TaxID=2975917 RepID=UPI002E352630|nr:hypothetical protein [Streptomyces sp. NBC_01716]